jgi:hypothetical protein
MTGNSLNPLFESIENFISISRASCRAIPDYYIEGKTVQENCLVGVAHDFRAYPFNV